MVLTITNQLIEKARILQSFLPCIREFYRKTFVIEHGGFTIIEESLGVSVGRCNYRQKNTPFHTPVGFHGRRYKH